MLLCFGAWSRGGWLVQRENRHEGCPREKRSKHRADIKRLWGGLAEVRFPGFGNGMWVSSTLATLYLYAFPHTVLVHSARPVDAHPKQHSRTCRTASALPFCAPAETPRQPLRARTSRDSIAQTARRSLTFGPVNPGFPASGTSWLVPVLIDAPNPFVVLAAESRYVEVGVPLGVKPAP